MQKFFDGFYPESPPYLIVANVEPRHIPTYSAVYVIAGSNMVVKYVGQTTNMQQRYRDHVKWMNKTDRIGWIFCEPNELLFMEAWFIATLRPWRNANQNKRSTRTYTSCSAKISTCVESVWKKGRAAVVEFYNNWGVTERLNGKITGLPKDFKNTDSSWELRDRLDQVCVDGEWYPRRRVTILLP